MTDEQALLAAVCSRPADDTPRLVYADWLDDRAGEPTLRAAFIRAACEAEVNGVVPGDAAGDGRPARVRLVSIEPSEAMAAAWLPPGVRPHWCEWSRGFVDTLVCTAAEFFARADALYWHPSQPRACPPTAQPLARVRLRTWPTPEDLARHPWHLWKPQTGDLLPAILSVEFPGVAFELPAEPPLLGPAFRVVPDSYARVRRAVLSAVLMIALAMPPGASD